MCASDLLVSKSKWESGSSITPSLNTKWFFAITQTSLWAKERKGKTETEWFSSENTLAQTSVEKRGKQIVSIHLSESCLLSVDLNAKKSSTSYSVTPLPSFPLLSLCLHFTHWVINASVVALTRLLFYQRESEVAAFHGHLDTFHKSCKAEVNCKDKILCLKCAGARRHSMVGNNIFPVGCINLPVECNLYIYTSLYLYYLNG